MSRIIERAKALFLFLFLPREASAPAERAEQSTPTEPAPPKVSSKKAPVDDNTTQWVLRGQILDRLGEYIFCMRRLRKIAPDDYGLFSRVGCAIPAEKYRFSSDPVLDKEISFGGVFGLFDVDRSPDFLYPSFLYFMRLEKPAPDVEGFSGTVYQLTTIYDDRQKGTRWKATRSGVGICHFGVLKDGRIRLLKQKEHIRHRIPQKTPQSRRHGPLWLNQAVWRYPQWVLDQGKERGETAEGWARGLFGLVYATYRESVGNILISASRLGVTAAFGIDLKRAPYFFSDRDLVAITPNGSRKKIFHSVRAHERTLADGRVIDVRAHFKGLREFGWNGYDIAITWPGKNQDLLLGEGVGGFSEEDTSEPLSKDSISTERFGGLISEVLRNKPGAPMPPVCAKENRPEARG